MGIAFQLASQLNIVKIQIENIFWRYTLAMQQMIDALQHQSGLARASRAG